MIYKQSFIKETNFLNTLKCSNFNWLEHLRYFFSRLYSCDRVHKAGHTILSKYRTGTGVNFLKS